MKFSNGKWWLIIGSLAFIGVYVRGAISAFGYGFSDTVFGLIDWLAASVIYFFYGALLGHAIDWWRARTQKKFTHPLWVWFSLGFWVISSVLVFTLKGAGTTEEFWLYLFFPMTFGIFLPAFAYDLLFPGLIAAKPWSKILLDLVFLSFFGVWLWSQLKKKVILHKVLLGLIFLVLLLGLGGCLRSLV